VTVSDVCLLFSFPGGLLGAKDNYWAGALGEPDVHCPSSGCENNAKQNFTDLQVMINWEIYLICSYLAGLLLPNWCSAGVVHKRMLIRWSQGSVFTNRRTRPRQG
jgi:hypothetical protein